MRFEGNEKYILLGNMKRKDSVGDEIQMKEKY
jgi:hypothetical protein